MYEEIADALADALAAERAVIPGPHALQAIAAPFNERLVAFLDRPEARLASLGRRAG